ncbi:ribulose-phosphate 3-epimerase [Gemella sp. GH3]|uniref:ribulose-phosphate 3-epimerase n=1 Tax=unclassified Gemella TaxID=2624949 RepID=UPI0015D07433|nr:MULTISPECIES: ribulose-phosphate 3-epimerase [unclassified Gemella]MBF0713245.1 ribulose-phosphate 3-epimerase [Gemella sp. GH3.1]NYS50197.1 ribulose-phosphate 3-epimerase [Gemella sp. GH3]
MKKILPSILSADFANLERDIKNMESLGVDYFHIDVMDGNFVPNISLGFPIIESIRKISNSVFDVHLMINNPELYVEKFCDIGADMVSFHIETTNHADRILQLIKDKGKKAGIVLNPHTPINSIKYLLHKVDYVLIMTVNPGFGGQRFIPEMLNKIKELDTIRKESNYTFLIEVDGGINIQTSKKCREAGADLLVCGSFLFGAENKENTLKELLK